MSALLDWSDRGTAVIFGDGAGAMVLGEGDGYLASKLYAKGNDTILSIPNNTNASPYYQNKRDETGIKMNGQETFRFAVNAMCSDLVDVINTAGLNLEDIEWIIPHQANARIIDAAAKRIGISQERCLKNIEKVGNTSAASIPILADELFRSGRVCDGDYIAMCSFGAGLTSAACIIKV